MMRKIQYLKNKNYPIIFKEYLEDIENCDPFNWTEPVNFEKCCISVFDHWLNEEEARNRIKPFYPFISSIERNKREFPNLINFVSNYYTSESKIMSFYLSLYIDFKIIFYNYEQKKFYKCISLENYFEIFQNIIREKKNSDCCPPEFFIPELKTIIVGNYDFTPVIYYKNKKNFLKLKEYINKSSLHILK